MADAFRSAGYGVGSVGWGERAAVVAVDFQLAFTSPQFPLGGSAHITAAVEHAAPVLDAARAAGALVVHTAAAWSAQAEFGRWKIPSMIDITPTSLAAQIDPALWDPTDLYMLKRYPSAFFGTHLVSVLQCAGVDTVVVMGATTSGCVRATVVDCFSHGFRTVVAEQCCGDQEAEAHVANMRDVGRRYADVLDDEAVLAGLAQQRSRAVAG